MVPPHLKNDLKHVLLENGLVQQILIEDVEKYFFRNFF